LTGFQAQEGLCGGNLHLPSVILAAPSPPPESSLISLKSTLAAALLGLAAAAHAQQQVVIVTSFPKELTEAYKKAFEAKNPGIKVEILNKPTPAGVAYIREAPASNKPDVFWVSAPDAFEVLATEKLLAKIESPAKEVPAKIGNYPINDPQGFYLGQALAGYGIMWNTRYTKANKLPDPKEWSDLTKPVYFSHVAMSSPSRSGTTHLTVETILQGEGWTKGWRDMLMIAGNSAAITERSFGVPDGVNNGQYGIGLVIDFFGLAGKASKFPVEFVYPAVTAIVPANIGIVAGAKNADNAKKFVNFTLSPEGQELLFDPAISRLPVLPSVYKKAPAGFPNPFTGTIKPKVNFDSDLSESRYYVVSSIFDQTITFRHKDLVAAAKAINEATAKLAGKNNPAAQKLLAEARDLAYSPIVSEDKSKDKEFLALYRNTKRDAEKTKQTTGLEEYWSNTARKNYARAVELAKEAAALAK
jgi:ABC-type Fe3+ transport system substrate-binding protein